MAACVENAMQDLALDAVDACAAAETAKAVVPEQPGTPDAAQTASEEPNGTADKAKKQRRRRGKKPAAAAALRRDPPCGHPRTNTCIAFFCRGGRRLSPSSASASRSLLTRTASAASRGRGAWHALFAKNHQSPSRADARRRARDARSDPRPRSS